ncbi:MAG: xanthine dehydrogenase accessory protein XdhC [Gammaproteobacteria bacterium]|nr:xanthine dehydrogenase accessory protein XdhC [Gammaproteobacteria bacterium]
MNRCFSTLRDIVADGQPCVLVTVAHIAGSAPREPGARMIVTPTQVMGTIGGGNLEFEAMRIARERLADVSDTGVQRHIELFPLGPMLQQCCGGAVFLHFEVLADAGADWIATAAGIEQNNTRTVLVSRTSSSSFTSKIEQNNTRALLASQTSCPSFPRRRESSEIPPAESGHYPGKMIFTKTGATGSLGDKRLDELAARKADELLSAGGVPGSLLHPLVETQSTLPDTSDALFFEMISPCKYRVALFGAGHVGGALVNILAGISDCRVTWVDSRAGQFPPELPPNVEARLSDNPVAEVENLPQQAYCLVMTHDHQLDQDLCEALLRRNDFAFLGLIGSATKQRRFSQRLREKGISEQQLERLTCPIGIPGIESKEPGVIAVAVAAQLLKILSADDAD